MKTKNEEKTVTTTKSTSIFSSGLMSMLSFVAVCIGGIALFLAMILSKVGLQATWIGTLQTIANAIGWLTLCLLSIRHIIHRRRLGIWIVWVIAIVMIFSGIIIPLFA